MSQTSKVAIGLVGFATLALLIVMGHEGGSIWARQYEETERGKCGQYVHDTLQTPAGQTRDLYVKIHECVDQGYLSEDYKRRYQL
jgi:hypothetical protein